MTFKATFWRENIQLANGGYETSRTFEAKNWEEADKRLAEYADCAYGSMELLDIVELN